MSHLQNDYFPFAFFKGNIIKTEEAQVSIMTNALQYGTAIFGGIRAYCNKKTQSISIFRMHDHFKRFLQSFKIIGVEIPYTHDQLIDITMDLMKKNKPTTDTYIRPFGYAGSINLSPNLQRDHMFDLAEYMIPLGDYIPTSKGVSVMVSSWRRISDNSIPSRAKVSGAYINSALAKMEAMHHGHEEAIFLTEQGHVAEGSAMNIFIVRDGVLVTPPKTDDILEGITRRTIIEIAQDNNIPVEERSIDRSELYICDEAFFSGTGAQVAWIQKIDNRQVGDGKRGNITEIIQNTYFSAVRGDEKKYKHHCTVIPFK